MGGKSQVLHIFKDYFPDFANINGYIEPFLGGANVYFYVMENWKAKLEGKPIYISDVNKELINCYRCVRNSVNKVIPLLEEHQKLNSEKHYYDVRNEYPPGDKMTDVEKAAAFIYLSRAAFGGLWRVNSQGKMNAPFNKNPNINIMNRELGNELRNYSVLLKQAEIKLSSFENILTINGGNLKGWFCYLDPPYFDIGNNAFTGYSKDGYSVANRLNLPKVFKELDKKGCKVMMSNSDASVIYRDFKDFNIHNITTNRTTGIQLSSITKEKMGDAKKLKEVVVINYKINDKQRTMDNSWGEYI